MELIKRIEYSVQIDGTLKLLQNTTDAAVNGMIRWNGSDLQGCVNGSWVSLTSNVSSISHNVLIDKQGGGIDNDFYHLSLNSYNNVLSLSNSIYTQLANIQTSVIGTSQWEYLSALNQNLTIGSAPEFSNINITGLNDGPLSLSGGFLSTSILLDLTSKVTGVLPIVNGGTNSDTELVNGFVMVSDNGKIIESSVTIDILQLLDGITSISTGSGLDNDKLVTKGYVDESIDAIPFVTAGNGLSMGGLSNETVKIGGTFTEDTYLFGDGFTLNFGNPMHAFTACNMYANSFWWNATETFTIASGTNNFAGLVYNEDNSVNFVNRSIPDVEWVNTRLTNTISNLLLPIENGGTNSNTALGNNKVMVSSFGKIIESTSVSTTNLNVLSGITSVVTGTTNNNKFVTQGYVNDYVNSSINSVIKLQGDWDAATNLPDITSTLTTGYAWRVSTQGTTNLGGLASWMPGDMAVKSATGWLRIEGNDISAVWGNISGDIANQTDLASYISNNTTDKVSKSGDIMSGNLQLDAQLLVGGYSSLGANQVFTLRGNASTYYRNTYMSPTPFGGVLFGPAIDYQTAGIITGVGRSFGGIQIAGLSNNYYSNISAVSITGYHGSNAPTVGVILLNAWKSNAGYDDRTSIADTEKIVSFSNGSLEKISIRGDGLLVYNNDLSFTNDLEVINKKYVDNAISTLDIQTLIDAHQTEIYIPNEVYFGNGNIYTYIFEDNLSTSYINNVKKISLDNNTSTPGTGYIAITPKALMSIPEANNVEYDGTRLYLTTSSRHAIAYVGDTILSSNTSIDASLYNNTLNTSITNVQLLADAVNQFVFGSSSFGRTYFISDTETSDTWRNGKINWKTIDGFLTEFDLNTNILHYHSVIGNIANASPIISNIADTSLYNIGDIVSGHSYIPYGAVIIAKTANTITISNNATGTANGANFEVLNKIYVNISGGQTTTAHINRRNITYTGNGAITHNSNTEYLIEQTIEDLKQPITYFDSSINIISVGTKGFLNYRVATASNRTALTNFLDFKLKFKSYKSNVNMHHFQLSSLGNDDYKNNDYNNYHIEYDFVDVVGSWCVCTMAYYSQMKVIMNITKATSDSFWNAYYYCFIFNIDGGKILCPSNVYAIQCGCHYNYINVQRVNCYIEGKVSFSNCSGILNIVVKNSDYAGFSSWSNGYKQLLINGSIEATNTECSGHILLQANVGTLRIFGYSDGMPIINGSFSGLIINDPSPYTVTIRGENIFASSIILSADRTVIFEGHCGNSGYNSVLSISAGHFINKGTLVDGFYGIQISGTGKLTNTNAGTIKYSRIGIQQYGGTVILQGRIERWNSGYAEHAVIVKQAGNLTIGAGCRCKSEKQPILCSVDNTDSRNVKFEVGWVFNLDPLTAHPSGYAPIPLLSGYSGLVDANID